MTTKVSGATLNPPAQAENSGAGKSSSDFAAQWVEACLVYPFYAALAKEFNLSASPYPEGELPPARPTRSIFDRDLKWLDSIDGELLAYQIRQLPPQILNASEESLRAVIHRQLRKTDKNDVDRDKIDLLLVQYFAMCAPEHMYRKPVTLEDVASVLRPVLAEADATPLEWCEPLEQILAKTEDCRSLRDLLEGGLVEQGRLLKDSAGCMFYDPAALVAFCRFSFLVRRAFIRMLHEDLKAVRETINALEALGVKTVDCRRAGFSAAETTRQLRFFCENWRQPFQKDYTQSSVNYALEQLLALRNDLEDALERAKPETDSLAFVKPDGKSESLSEPAPSADVATGSSPESSEPVSPVAVSEPAQTEQAPAAQAPAAPPKATSSASGSSVAPLDAEKCLEAIWEQLIAAPPARGRSMSTVVLQDTKVLLSSWEVAAFVSEGSQESEDLRRAVVARALLAVAADSRKRSGDQSALAAALKLARTEVSYFHGRVEQAKRAKHIEAAVNLGISTKRLLSFMEEAEQLQP